jgi:hypothetical protein
MMMYLMFMLTSRHHRGRYPSLVCLVQIWIRTHLLRGLNDRLCSNANDTASRSWSRIAGLLGLLVASLAKVIGACVDDDGALFNHQHLTK